jgi:alkanesulfonate monooxygenase SsuD/methylene tetrahydromethanopterin reductase-like flavin-dependent oxidoreductase (luciferase family)
VVDELLVHGSPAECRKQVQAYAEAGVDVPVMALIPPPGLTPDTLLPLLSALSP